MLYQKLEFLNMPLFEINSKEFYDEPKQKEFKI